MSRRRLRLQDFQRALQRLLAFATEVPRIDLFRLVADAVGIGRQPLAALRPDPQRRKVQLLRVRPGDVAQRLDYGWIVRTQLLLHQHDGMAKDRARADEISDVGVPLGDEGQDRHAPRVAPPVHPLAQLHQVSHVALGVAETSELGQALRQLAQHVLLADVIEAVAASIDQQRTFERRHRLFVLTARCQRVTQSAQRLQQLRARGAAMLLDSRHGLRKGFLGSYVVLGAVLGVTEQRQGLGQRQRLLRS